MKDKIIIVKIYEVSKYDSPKIKYSELEGDQALGMEIVYNGSPNSIAKQHFLLVLIP